MKYKDFEDYLAEKCHKINPSLDDDCVEVYEDWIADLEPELFIAYAEQYKNICVDQTILTPNEKAITKTNFLDRMSDSAFEDAIGNEE